MDPPKGRVRGGLYKKILDEFCASGHQCMGRKFEDPKDARDFALRLQYVIRRSAHPVKASKAGSVVYLIREEDDE